ncbi:hypothetical protein HYU06_01530 [Candidatus Woesearchaeota archaeon]|nr:hypothetical protein [Candidatus Woesearchaeota archaeon]
MTQTSKEKKILTKREYDNLYLFLIGLQSKTINIKEVVDFIIHLKHNTIQSEREEIFKRIRFHIKDAIKAGDLTFNFKIKTEDEIDLWIENLLELINLELKQRLGVK